VGNRSKIQVSAVGRTVALHLVFEKEDSKWELIDGLQRISTILEYGIVKRPLHRLLETAINFMIYFSDSMQGAYRQTHKSCGTA
jgi:hypothetical protein